MAQEDVLSDGQVLIQAEFLVDGRDAARGAETGSGMRVSSRTAGSIPGLSADPGHNLDQGRFAGAVFAEQRADFALVEREIDILERLDAAISLGDMLDFERYACCVSTVRAPSVALGSVCQSGERSRRYQGVDFCQIRDGGLRALPGRADAAATVAS